MTSAPISGARFAVRSATWILGVIGARLSISTKAVADECPGSRPFDDPIPTPKGKTLRTLRDAAAYIMALPKRGAEAEHLQIAMAQLIDAAAWRNFLMHARIGMLRALNHGKPDPAITPRRKPREILQDRAMKTVWIYVEPPQREWPLQ